MSKTTSAEYPQQSKRAGPLLFLAFSSIWTGLVLTEFVSNNVLGLTISRFTESAFVIGILMAINPAFGFIANPIIGIIGDRIWTPVGRRAFFLIVGAPIVAFCLILVPNTPETLSWFAGLFGAEKETVLSVSENVTYNLILLISLIVVFQLVQDILWGSDHPLLADLVPPEMRTRMVGTMNTCAQIAGFFFMRYALDGGPNFFGEKLPYYLAAGAQVILVAAAAFYIGRLEQPPVRSNRPKLTFKRYLSDAFSDPTLRRYLIMVLTSSFALNCVQGFTALYAVKTLLMERSAYGEAWSYFSLIALLSAFAIGWLIERFLPKPTALACAYSIMLVACVIGYFSTDQAGLSIVAIVFAFGAVAYQVTYKAFYTEFLPPDIIGQLSGVLNISYALGRMSALILGGAVIGLLDNDYSYIWPMSAIAAIVSIVLVLRIPDPRFEARKAQNA